MKIRAYALKWGVIERQITKITLFTFVMLLILYVYFVGSSVMNVVLRKDMRLEIGQLSAQVADLESKYIKYEDKLTFNRAGDFNLGSIESKYFVNPVNVLGQANLSN